jgi:hypothetical protein
MKMNGTARTDISLQDLWEELEEAGGEIIPVTRLAEFIAGRTSRG